MPPDLLSVHSVEGEAREPTPDKEMQQFMARVGAFEEELKSPAPGSSAAVCTSLTRPPLCACRTRIVLTTDGPFAESKEHLGGFYIVEAEDLDAALSWASKTAECVKTAIEVRPFWDQRKA